MRNQKLGSVFKRVLLVEDNQDICDFYKDFFEIEMLSVDIVQTVPVAQLSVADFYDVLITDWLVGAHSVREWLLSNYRQKKLPLVTIVATGMMDIEDQIQGLPVHLIYKPFDFGDFKEMMFNLKENQ